MTPKSASRGAPEARWGDDEKSKSHAHRTCSANATSAQIALSTALRSRSVHGILQHPQCHKQATKAGGARAAIVCPIHTHTSTWRRPWTDRRTGEHTRTHCSRRGARTVTCRSCTTHAQSHPCTSATLHVAGSQRCSLHPCLKRQQRWCRSLCTVALGISSCQRASWLVQLDAFGEHYGSPTGRPCGIGIGLRQAAGKANEAARGHAATNRLGAELERWLEGRHP